MKTLIFVIYLLLLSINAFSQEFTLSELVQIADMKQSDFLTYISDKGYVYGDTEKKEEYVTTTYKYNDKQRIGYFINQTVFAQNDSTPAEIIISFQTIYKEDFAAISAQLKSAGFKFVKTEKHEDIDKNATWQIYQKGTIELSLISGESGFDDHLTVYEISVDKTGS